MFMLRKAHLQTFHPHTRRSSRPLLYLLQISTSRVMAGAHTLDDKRDADLGSSWPLWVRRIQLCMYISAESHDLEVTYLVSEQRPLGDILLVSSHDSSEWQSD
jgi:hypothetical protein